MKKIVLTAIILMLFTSCLNKSVYKNNDFRYKVNIPNGWIFLSNTARSDNSAEFEETLKNFQSTNIRVQNVDVAIFNPASEPPVFEVISIKTILTRVDINNLSQNLDTLQMLIKAQFAQIYPDITINEVEYTPFGTGNYLRINMSFNYENNPYNCNYIVLPGNLMGTHFITFITKDGSSSSSDHIIDSFMKSFRRF